MPKEPRAPELTSSERISIRIATTQTVLAVIGMVTGLIALYAALEQADANRKQLQAAVWPALQVGFNNFDQQKNARVFRFVVSNVGNGPARIRSVEISVGGRPQKDWAGAMAAAAGLSENEFLTSFLRGRVVRSGETVEALSLEDPAATKLFAGLERAGEGQGIFWKMCYCSVFDDCWISSGSLSGDGGDRVAATKSCPDYGAAGFTQ